MRSIAVMLLLVASCASWHACAQTQALVHTSLGTVRGVATADLHVFKGIPYAQPPSGGRRWRAPLPASKWQGVRAATEFGPACFQPKSHPGSIYSDDPPSMSEDCLSLNIWAPVNAGKVPVFFWIHGGALNAGSSRESVFDGAALARRGVLVVSINYRLGVFGYLAHPALSAESTDKVSGNYGLLDQIAALHWVKNNIAAFGGDPFNVTIAGESAGGLSVMYLLASPLARGLFAKAISQSAYMISTPELRASPYGDVPAEMAGVALVEKLQATGIDELRKMDAATLAETAPAAGFVPYGNVDGHVLKRQLVDTFDRGEQAKVPMIAGFNSGEIRSLRFLAPPPPADAATYTRLIRERYADMADAFLEHYPPNNLPEIVLEVPRDAIYGWTAERLIIKQTAAGMRAYLYFFDHGYPAAEAAGLHAFHASEIPYLFGTSDRTPPAWPKVEQGPIEAQLSDALMSYWTTFARSGDPSPAAWPRWAAYDTGRAFMHFAAAPQPSVHLLPGMYELNEQVVCRRRAAGNIPWNWNIGILSPPLPAKATGC